MNNDHLVWQIINRAFCSYKIKTKTGNFCRNENNVTGTCSRHSCPLANSQYATIKEKDGIIYLYIKAPERTPYPAKQWERIKLKRNEEQAIEQINRHLAYWDRWMRSRVKKRFNRVRLYLRRMRKLALGRQKKLEPIKKKVERRELHREEKALRVARISKTVENELLERIRAGTNADEIYNINQEAFEKALETAELSEDEEYEQEAEDDSDEELVYTDGSDLDEEEEEIEDFAPMEESEESEPELVEVPTTSSRSSKRRKVIVSHEKDDD